MKTNQEPADELLALGEFLSLCFHQDFLDDFENDRQAVDAYLRTHTNAKVRLVLEDLEWLLGEILDRRIADDAVGILLEEQLYCFFRPERDENTRWLEQLRGQLRQHLNNRPSLIPPSIRLRPPKPERSS